MANSMVAEIIDFGETQSFTVDQLLSKNTACSNLIAATNMVTLSVDNVDSELKVAEPPYNLSTLAGQYEVCPTIKACVDVLTNSVVGPGITIVPSDEHERDISTVGQDDGISDGDASTQQKRYRRERTELALVLETCGHDPERGELKEFEGVQALVYKDLKTVGNGYYEITRDIEFGKIKRIFHIPAVTMRVLADHTGFVQINAHGNVVAEFKNIGDPKQSNCRVTGKPKTEIVHIKNAAPDRSFYGLPDYIAAMHEVVGDYHASAYQVGFFIHNTIPAMMIFYSDALIDDDNATQLDETIKKAVREKTHKTVMQVVSASAFEDGPDKLPIKIERLAMARDKDAEFIEYRRFTREQIGMTYGVPPLKLGILGDVTGGGSPEFQDSTYREQTVRPQQRAIFNMWTNIFRHYFMLTKDGFTGLKEIALQSKPIDIIDAAANAEILERLARARVLTTNEMRAKFAYGKVNGGDEIIIEGPGGNPVTLSQLEAMLANPEKYFPQEKPQEKKPEEEPKDDA